MKIPLDSVDMELSSGRCPTVQFSPMVKPHVMVSFWGAEIEEPQYFNVLENYLFYFDVKKCLYEIRSFSKVKQEAEVKQVLGLSSCFSFSFFS